MVVSASILGWTWLVVVGMMYMVMFVSVVWAERYEIPRDAELEEGVRKVRFNSTMFAFALALPLLCSVALAGSSDYYYTLVSVWFWLILASMAGTVTLFGIWVAGMKHQTRELKELSIQSDLAISAIQE